MAIVFEMWAECGSGTDRDALVKHFDGFQSRLIRGRTIVWKASPTSWLPTGMIVSSDGLSHSGIRNLQDAVESTESGLRLYHHLKSAPAFRFARVAWEAENIPMAELGDYVAHDGECRFEVQCVVDDLLYRQLGSPKFCFPFRDGYWWTRYYGEAYRPLYSSDQTDLNALCRSLFPEFSKY